MKSSQEQIQHWFFDRIEQNYAEIKAGKYAMRLAAIRDIGNPIGRRSEQTLLAAIHRQPKLFGILLDIDLPDGRVFAGSNGHSTMITDTQGGLTTRVHRASTRLTPGDRQLMVNKFDAEHGLVKTYMGPFVFGASASCDAHPFRRGQEAVTMRHEVIRGHDPRIFGTQYARIDRAALASTTERLAVPGEFHDFAQRGLALWNDERLLIDVSAPQGVLLTADGGLVLSNMLPLQNPNGGDVERIIGELKLLDAAV